MKRFILSILFALLLIPASSQNYGVVLSGGGGKGAYEVGVWRALEEYGIAQKSSVISGTSVGGLNAVLLTCLDQDKSEYLWREIVPEVLTNDTEIISQNGLSSILDAIDLSYVQNCNYPKLYVSAVKDDFTMLKLIVSPFYSFGDKTSRFLLNEENADEIKKLLLATSAVPLLTSPVKLSDGNYYVDGGGEEYGGDNIPVYPVYKNHKELDTIVVVYLSNKPDRRVRQEDYPDVQILEMIPSINLKGVWGSIDFSRETIELIMEQGYQDTVKTLEAKGYKKVASWWFEE